MDQSIILLTGNVKFNLTLDPSVWIFDDRKVNLNTFFLNKEDKFTEDIQYQEKISKIWDRELSEGPEKQAIPNSENEKFEKQKILQGTFGILLEPFINNAVPNEDAKTVTLITSTEEKTLSLDEAKKGILKFSNEGKPLREDGPVHFYYGDGSNQTNPIRNISKIVIN